MLKKQSEIKLTILLSVLVVLTNTFLVSNVFGSIELYFGSIFVLLSLLTLRLRYSIFVLIVSIIPILLFSEQLFIALIHTFEYAFIALMLKYRVRFLAIISLFWLLIGLPLTSAYIIYYQVVNIQTAFFIAFEFSLIAYIVGFVVLLTYWLLPTYLQRSGNNQHPPKFTRLIFELNTVSVIFPVVVVTLFFLWRTAENEDQGLGTELSQAIQEINRSVIGLLENKIHSLQSTAESIKNEHNSAYHSLILNTVANATANVESMVVVDKDANVLLAAPQKYAELLPDLSDLNISYRKYFQQTKATLLPVVSRAIKGKGLGDLDILAITAPIIIDSEFQGLVQAAIKLDNLVNANVINAIQNNGIEVLITDNENSIIYASDTLKLAMLDKFVVQDDAHPFAQNRRAMNINGSSYIYDSHENTRNWTIYTLVSPTRIFEDIYTYFLFIGSSLLFSILLISILSKGLAAKIIKPLLNLEQFMANKTDGDVILAESRISQEMLNVTKSVVENQTLLLDFQNQLKIQVKDKTQELQILNEELLKLSQIDALTGLYNRGTFDTLASNTYKYCQRHTKPFTLVIFDIDHFKQINDRYGHVVGDACITKVASLIQAKCRRDTDIVARYGGEEFILLFASDKHEQHQQYAQAIQASIQNYTLIHGEHSIKMKISGGVLKVQNDFTKELNSLIALADEQLYISKNRGRNQINYAQI